MCNWLSDWKCVGTKLKPESSNSISVFYLVPKHCQSEIQLYMMPLDALFDEILEFF